MKHWQKSVWIALAACALIWSTVIGCGSVRTTSAGSENVAYLQIAGDPWQYDKVTVVLDGKDSFEAKVNDSHQRAVKNEHSYKIAVGAHDIEVRYGGAVITKKKIFASANQVKIVEVP
ncbi:MAG: hypothetical protein IJP62_01170 [Treponema sp.]|nr:hypothetical protein [Treponema sp.]